jgi:hypothetical protein
MTQPATTTTTTSALDPSTLEAVNNANFKTFGEVGIQIQNQALMLMNQAYQNSIAHQKNVDALSEVALARAMKSITAVDAVQAMSDLKLLTGNDVSSQLGDLAAVVASIQQYSKTATTTPPVTSTATTTPTTGTTTTTPAT